MKQSARPDLNQIVTYYHVAKCRSFTRAAVALQMPKSTVSQQIHALEARLGARLIQRTTRNLVLTEAGQLFFTYCERSVAEAEEAERAVTSYAAEPRGLLRVGVPATFARVFLAPVLPLFCRKYPEVKFEFVIPGGRMDPLQNLLDVVIRVGRVEDSSYVVRSQGSLRRGLYAAPGYLRTRPTPREPRELAEHSLIATGREPSGTQWKLRHRDGREEEVRFDPQLAVPDPVLACDLARSDLGIASLPEFVTRDGPPLVRVLEEWAPAPVQVLALYPARELTPWKVKVFLEELEKNLGWQAGWQAGWQGVPARGAGGD
jgi:DNA-binding transcriptional LysR family regulator